MEDEWRIGRVKLLVLGGTGAMGSYLIDIAAANGDEVYITSRKKHISVRKGIHYLLGDAMNDDFIFPLLKQNYYDAIIDFMSYTTKCFANRYKVLLHATNQYIFLSSSRVYAESSIIIEASERLLDVCMDQDYLNTDEYALSKARQEDLLIDSGLKNWTIVRPYITYSNQRLQLGILEKDQWLYRAINGKTIVFSKDIAECVTTLTFGGDVAMAIYSLIGGRTCFGQIYQLTQPKSLKWKDVLDIYCDVIESNCGNRPKVILENSAEKLARTIGRVYQLKYDRLYNRVFDSSRVYQICHYLEDAIDTDSGLKRCLNEFFEKGLSCSKPDWKYEGYADKIAHEHTKIRHIKGLKNKGRYIMARYSNLFEKR